MINLLLGAPGGGKGYEACVYHILAALEKGRKVITNMPLVLDRWRDIDPSYPALIEIRTKSSPKLGRWDPSQETGAFVLGEQDEEEEEAKTGFQRSGYFMGRSFLPRPKPRIAGRAFASVWDYYSTWCHPENGSGPLYVIDECHMVIPRAGSDPEVLEWFALHRHFNCDVLLVTQAYGKISQDVRDLVQLCYRVRKNIALGSKNTYVRKVQDGIRGQVVNEGVRKYDKRYFGLWRSHTQGVAAEEFNASDVRPLWKHWSVVGAGICLVWAVVAGIRGDLNPFGKARPATVAASAVPGRSASAVEIRPAVAVVVPSSAPAAQASSAPAPAASSASSPDGASVSLAGAPAVDEAGRPEPFFRHELHLAGQVSPAGGRPRHLFAVSQSGQFLQLVTDAELREAGYRVEVLGRCVAFLTWGSHTSVAVCDAPRAGDAVPDMPGRGPKT